MAASLSVLIPLCVIAAVCGVYRTQRKQLIRSFTIDYHNNTFLKDGKPFRYISGSIHYSRVHKNYWMDRLEKMYAAGLDAIQVYVPWNVHEPEQGVFDFSGKNDLVGFIQMAQTIGLLVLVRAGPYIDGEWEFGGFPAWILRKNPHTIFRTMNPVYIKCVDQWLAVLLPKLKPLLYVNGGPVIMVQIENEYGSYNSPHACDRSYMLHLRDQFTSYLGNQVVLYTTDGCLDSKFKCGPVPGVFATTDFGVHYPPALGFGPLRKYQPHGPLDNFDMGSIPKWIVAETEISAINPFTSTDLYAHVNVRCMQILDSETVRQVNSEFYTGWLDYWGEKHQTVSKLLLTFMLNQLLSYNANVNMYMFEGGTNFGYWNGADDNPFHPVPTSYDYDAPLTEAGDITEKYHLIRNTISKYKRLPSVPVPPSTAKAKYGTVQMSFMSTLHDLLHIISPSGPVKTRYPITMETAGQYMGFAMYRHLLKKSIAKPEVLFARDLRDRGYVMVDKVPFGILIRDKVSRMSITGKKGQWLDILVENQGHICFNRGINNNSKGLISNVTLGGEILQDWFVYPIKLELVSSLTINSFKFMKNKVPKSRSGLLTPSFYTGHLTVKSELHDTYLDMSGWTKGQVLIGSKEMHNLGRYWPVMGPQVRLYVPKFYLDTKSSTVVMLELENAPCQDLHQCFVSFVDQPLINRTTNFNHQHWKL